MKTPTNIKAMFISEMDILYVDLYSIIRPVRLTSNPPLYIEST